MELGLPRDIMIVSIQRSKDTIIPRGDVILKDGDLIVLCAENTKDIEPINLKEITIGAGHSWNGVAIKDLDISRQSYIFMIRRNGKAIIPRGNVVIKANDTLLMYEKHNKADLII